MITQETLKRHFFYDPLTGQFTRLLSQHRPDRVGLFAAKPDAAGYMQVSVAGRQIRAHRLAWLYVYGYMPKMIDHKNGDRADNRIENLRPATASQNASNSKLRKCNTSGHTNVY